MAYPVTLNGRTYTLADFEGTNYVDGLPDAFEDFVTHAGDIYNDTSTSSIAIGTGSKTFTVSSAKPYQAGTPLRIADSANPETNFLDCIVTSYSGTTLVVNAFGYAGSGTIASWTINIGGAKTVDGTLAVSQGGTGATTASDARTNLDVYSKADADSRFLNVSGEASNVTMTGDVTIGDTSGDTLTVNATATFANGVSFGDNVISGDDIDGGTISNFASTGIDDNATSTKLTVSDTGIDVTGTVTSDGLTVDGDTLLKASGTNTTPLKVFSDNSATNNTTTIEIGDFTGGGLYEIPRASLIGQRAGSGSGGVLTFTTGESSAGTLTNRITIDSNGDISFYEDTGTSQAFFWDASTERLGIGTTSPAYKLDIYGDSSSHVDVLHLLNENLTSGNSVGVMFENYSGASLNQGRIKYLNAGSNNSNSFVFEQEINGVNGLQETMRLDNSGNLLVGTTSVSGFLNSTSETGSISYSGGVIAATASSDSAAYFKRLTDDGPIVTFRDSTAATVGSIFSYNGFLGIGSPSGNDAYVLMGSDFVAPATSTGAARDGAIDLGSSTRRFKDFYLSGGAYLGGTGAANYLNDYEEGTWTPSFNSASFTASGVTSVSGAYVKIGDFVQVSFVIGFSGTSGNFAEGDAASIGGLPFNPVSFNGGGTANASQDYTNNVRMTWQTLPVGGSDDMVMIIHSGAGTIGRSTSITGVAMYSV